QLFKRSGRAMSDYITIRRVQPHWRSFFKDGTVINLYSDPEKMDAEAERIAPGSVQGLRDLLSYSAKQYDLIDYGYFKQGLDTAGEMLRFYGVKMLLQFDFWRSMHSAVVHHLRDPRLRDMFDFFIKYVGSSPGDAPGFMNCMSAVQFRHDLWYVEGGMYGIACGLGRLMKELSIGVHLKSEVRSIEKSGGEVTGLTLADGTFVAADIVVSNMEVIPTYQSLLQEDGGYVRRLVKQLEPSCSGVVIDLGLNCQYPQLAHHNCFFSENPKAFYTSVFHKQELPADPTVYVVAAARTDPSIAPKDCDSLKILAHVPHMNTKNQYTQYEYMEFKDRVIDKLEGMGLTDLRKHIVVEHVWTFLDIQEHYLSHCGSIYGVVSSRWINFGFKGPKQSPLYKNLFFTGGSVNPGGGMPMVILCGQSVAQKISRWDQH
ncbi:MAG: phytoene desaturase, partial [Kiritimatiellaceae bacterium]|nr:phytoene desaturase [Kiritimatiellaceae bacterium]